MDPVVVAFIGLGAMGAPMAANLARKGYTLRLYNRNGAKAVELASALPNATACASPADAARGAAYIWSIVADDAATRAVMLDASTGVIAAAAPGAIVLDSSTNSPSCSREMSAAFSGHGVAYLDAPVSGSTPQSIAGELVLMVGGDADAFAKAAPLFGAVGRMWRRMGTSGAGSTIKLVNNMMSAAAVAAAAEGAAIIEAAQLDPAAAVEVLSEGAAGSRITRFKLPAMLKREFQPPQFALALMDKDLHYFNTMARELGAHTPLAAATATQFAGAKKAGLGGLDIAAVFLRNQQ